MNWFEQMCRNAGLMVHNMRNPEAPAVQTREVGRTIQEAQVSPTVTLRRTTIDEVEVKSPAFSEPRP
jgi:hypothetical protein